ncbi:MAG: hydantoinase B/oxoprolinase family protein, partial [Rhodospirillaceae bacterium]
TVCGGSGAGYTFDGTSAVHTHMTNSRLTDPEVLEWRYPVLVEAFRIRSGSGGLGRFHGGDGTVRRLRFLEPMSVALLANRHRVPPFGLNGGYPGKPGAAWIKRAGGGRVWLRSTDRAEVAAGDVFVIQTPGGGGYGPPEGEPPGPPPAIVYEELDPWAAFKAEDIVQAAVKGRPAALPRFAEEAEEE